MRPIVGIIVFVALDLDRLVEELLACPQSRRQPVRNSLESSPLSCWQWIGAHGQQRCAQPLSGLVRYERSVWQSWCWALFSLDVKMYFEGTALNKNVQHNQYELKAPPPSDKKITPGAALRDHLPPPGDLEDSGWSQCALLGYTPY